MTNTGEIFARRVRFGLLALAQFVLTAMIYSALGGYLIAPHLTGYRDIHKLLFTCSLIAAALGTFTLSRKWLHSFLPALLAGLLYGFGPYLLSLGRYHFSATAIAAALPWLFIPAAFINKSKFNPIRIVLIILPFLIIAGLFMVANNLRLFPIPLGIGLNNNEFFAAISPYAFARRAAILPGLYHIPLVFMILGTLKLTDERRLPVAAFFASGILLTVFNPVPIANPVIWLAIPMLVMAILAGRGISAMICAARYESKYTALAAAAALILAVVSLLMAMRGFRAPAGMGTGFANLAIRSAHWYALAALAITAVWLITRKWRLLWLRTAILAAIAGADIFYGSVFLADRFF